MNVAIIIPFWSNLHLRVESDALIFLLYVLCDWFRKLMLLSQPIRCKIKPNHDLVSRVFPRFWKMEKCFVFCKKTVCYFITRLDRDLLVFRLKCPKKSESWHSFKLFSVKRKITICSFLVGLNREITAPLKRETTSIFYFLWSYIC